TCRCPGSRSPSSCTSPSRPKARAARGRTRSSSRSPASPAWTGKGEARRRRLGRTAADRLPHVLALVRTAAARAGGEEDPRTYEQGADEDDPQHRPRREQPRLRDHALAIGSRAAGRERRFEGTAGEAAGTRSLEWTL